MASDNPVWFRRFADIPGVRYTTPLELDLTRLEGRDAVPDGNRFGTSVYLWWATADGGTSQSPASEHASYEIRAATVTQIRTHIAEVLELPGEPKDYHYALQGTANELYARRRADSTTIDDAHRLFLLDLQLIQAEPAAVASEREDQPFYSIPGLSLLLRLYLTEGRVADAAAIADIAERFGAGDKPDVAAARARAAALAAEDRR